MKIGSHQSSLQGHPRDATFIPRFTFISCLKSARITFPAAPNQAFSCLCTGRFMFVIYRFELLVRVCCVFIVHTLLVACVFGFVATRTQVRLDLPAPLWHVLYGCVRFARSLARALSLSVSLFFSLSLSLSTNVDRVEPQTLRCVYVRERVREEHSSDSLI